MDSRFLSAVAAIRDGDVPAFQAILSESPELAADRSSCSHPTLMQCLVLDASKQSSATQLRMAGVLIDQGSPIDEPLIAAASIGNVVLAEYLLDQGAALEGTPDVSNGWTPLEESIYWGTPEITRLLLKRGARLLSLRAAAGVGRTSEMAGFFEPDGSLTEDCGGIHSPFGSFDEGESGGVTAHQHVLDNALVYAAMGGQVEAGAFLIERGADVTAHPIGFHFRGTPLHWAAIRGHAEVCNVLIESGADVADLDLTIHKTPADWARHEGHDDLAQRIAAVAPPSQVARDLPG